MRCHIALLLASICAVVGCGSSQALQSEIAILKAENATLKVASEQMQADVKRVQKDLDDLENELNDIRELAKSLGSGKDVLSNLLKQYGRGFEVAKDLELPEMNDSKMEDLLKLFVGGVTNEEKSAEENNMKEKQ